jgi:hypothetical protein
VCDDESDQTFNGDGDDEQVVVHGFSPSPLQQDDET